MTTTTTTTTAPTTVPAIAECNVRPLHLLHDDATRESAYRVLASKGFRDGSIIVGSRVSESADDANAPRVRVLLELSLPLSDSTVSDALDRTMRRIDAMHGVMDEPFGSVGVRVHSIEVPAAMNPAPEPAPAMIAREVTVGFSLRVSRTISQEATVDVERRVVVFAPSTLSADELREYLESDASEQLECYIESCDFGDIMEDAMRTQRVEWCDVDSAGDDGDKLESVDVDEVRVHDRAIRVASRQLPMFRVSSDEDGSLDIDELFALDDIQRAFDEAIENAFRLDA